MKRVNLERSFGLSLIWLAAGVAILGPLIAASRNSESATGPFLPVLPAGLNSLMPVPIDNPLTRAKVELGRRLFFDAKLSRDGTFACASCHKPELAFTDGRRTSFGVHGIPGRRNVPSLLNAAYLRTVFWDGRANTLEEQVSMPLTNVTEMANTLEFVIDTLRADETYRGFFARAFGLEEIGLPQLSQALAAFQRTLVAADSPFDRYSRGDGQVLSPAARRGLQLFKGKARCSRCHESELFTDHQFHNTGVNWGGRPQDLGRYELTGNEADKGKFKTPSLRNVALTAPYMHNGSLESLEAVVDFYNQGCNRNPHLDPMIRPLNLIERERQDLVSFLITLTSETFPELPSSTQIGR